MRYKLQRRRTTAPYAKATFIHTSLAPFGKPWSSPDTDAIPLVGRLARRAICKKHIVYVATSAKMVSESCYVYTNRQTRCFSRTDLDEADPFVFEQFNRFEHHRANTGGRDTESVEGGFSVGLVGVLQHAVEVDLWDRVVE